MTEKQIADLIQQLIDDVISPSDLEALNEILKKNPRAREILVDAMEIHSLLSEKTSKSAQIPEIAAEIVPIEKIVKRQRQRAIRASILSAAAAIVVGLFILKQFLVTAPESGAEFATSPGTEFTLSNQEESDTQKTRILKVGSSIQLSQGTVELKLSSGVRSVLTAPAHLTLTAANEVRMHEGLGWFHVPEEAIGFTVESKDLKVVDLGTEFGLKVSPEQHDEIHVFKGKVEATSLRVKKPSMIVSAGEAKRIDPIGRLNSIPLDSELFLTSLTKTLPYLHWPFEPGDFIEPEQNMARRDFNNKSASFNGAAPPRFVDGRVGHAIAFDGIDQHIISNWRGFDNSRPVTTAFWIFIPEHAENNKREGIIGWGDRTGKNRKWKLALSADKLSGELSLRVSWGNVWADTQAKLTPNQWHQVLVTAISPLNNDEPLAAEVYINGEYEKIIPKRQVNPRPVISLDTENAVPLLIGSTLHPKNHNRRTIHAYLDELYIYDGYMNQDMARRTLQDLAAKAQHTDSPPNQ